MRLRIARHTDDLEKIASFYIDALGFERLGSFENHSGYNGIFIGKPDADWHFEFTASNEKANHSPDQDDLVVLYPETQANYDNLIHRVLEHGIVFIPAKNPYWNENGKMFLDPDGFRIVISTNKITL